MQIIETVGPGVERPAIERNQRAAMRFGLTVGVLTVSAMLAGIYASAILALLS